MVSPQLFFRYNRQFIVRNITLISPSQGFLNILLKVVKFKMFWVRESWEVKLVVTFRLETYCSVLHSLIGDLITCCSSLLMLELQTLVQCTRPSRAELQLFCKCIKFIDMENNHILILHIAVQMLCRCWCQLALSLLQVGRSRGWHLVPLLSSPLLGSSWFNFNNRQQGGPCKYWEKQSSCSSHCPACTLIHSS